jgi:N-acetylmuramoyl-L-alanine amidase
MLCRSHIIPLITVLILGVSLIICACGPTKSVTPSTYKSRQTQEEQAYLKTATASRRNVNVTSLPLVSAMEPTDLLREARVYKDLIPRGQHARKYQRRMNPRYITIHSTQNYATGADAWRHSKALKDGKLRATKRPGGNRIGYLVWHYTVDDKVVVQHLPTNEQGEHADFDGPGNNYSIGIEMCEHRGNNRAETLERTAKLVAYLMHQHNIPISNVVPHYHWPRGGTSIPNKNCPHFLMDDGRPGKKWKGFQTTVQSYYTKITVPASRRVAQTSDRGGERANHQLVSMSTGSIIEGL